MPDAPKPKNVHPDHNIQLSEVLFDSSTGKFVVAVSEHRDDGFMEMVRQRKDMYPDEKKELPLTDPDIDGREFKQVEDPRYTKRRKKVEEVTKSCLDLAIDG